MRACVYNVFNNSRCVHKTASLPGQCAPLFAAMGDLNETIGDGRRLKNRGGRGENRGRLSLTPRPGADTSVTSPSSRWHLVPGPNAAPSEASWHTAGDGGMDGDKGGDSGRHRVSATPATVDLPQGATGAGEARSQASTDMALVVVKTDDKKKGSARGPAPKKGWGIELPPPAWHCDPGQSITIGTESMHAGPIRAMVKKMVTDPAKPDFPKGFFRDPANFRTRDVAYSLQQKPFQIGKGIWVPGHLSVDDWPQAIWAKTFTWDPSEVKGRYDALTRGKAVQVTLTEETATLNNMALCSYLVELVNRGSVKDENKVWRSEYTDNGWVPCGLCTRLCHLHDSSLRIAVTTGRVGTAQDDATFQVCPVCISANCEVELHQVRLLQQTLKNASCMKKAHIVNGWMAMTEEERSEDIGVIAAPVDQSALSSRDKTMVGPRAQCDELVMTSPPDAKPWSHEMAVWKESMAREARMQRQAASEISNRLKRSVEWKERGKVATLSLSRLKTINGSLVLVHGAMHLTQIASHVTFKNYMKWLCEERPATLDEIDRQQAYGTELLGKLMGLMSHQAIANVPDDMKGVKDDSDRWWRAGQYSDQVIPDRTGTGAFDFYYLCKGKQGNQELCWTVIAANCWKRKKSDPLATQQVWYCPLCGCKYKTTMGTLCEWRMGDMAYVCLATYPPIEIENLKAGMAATGFQAPSWITPSSPEALLSSIPMAVPTSTALIPVPGYEGCFKFDVDKLLSVPVMEWKQHFELGRQAATGQWKPPRDVPQVPAALPGPELIAVKDIPAVEKEGGFSWPSGPDHVGPPMLADEVFVARRAADYTHLWPLLNVELARSIIFTGEWDGLPVNAVQRQAAFDYLASQENEDAPRQARCAMYNRDEYW